MSIGQRSLRYGYGTHHENTDRFREEVFWVALGKEEECTAGTMSNVEMESVFRRGVCT
jgi:hypothetical protein